MADNAAVITSTTIPDLGLVVYRMLDMYREEDVPFGLAYQRRMGVWRLAKIVGDQLGLDEDEAYAIAAGIIGGVGEA